MLPSMPDQPSELVLTESRTMRAQTVDRVDVLDKVGALALLPDGVHVTTEGIASYYEVDTEAIKSLVRRNREELAENGLRVIRGTDLRDFKRSTEGQADPLSERINALTLFTRRTVLNVGQLLTESEVARRVRTYLLNVEEAASSEQRSDAVQKARETEAQLRAIEVLGRIDGNASYARGISRHLAARMLGQEPELDPLDVTITCDEYLADKGVLRRDMDSARSRLGKAVAALYRARYAREPQKIKRPIHGVHREVSVYTRRDEDLFDTAWAELGRHYSLQGELGGAA